MPCWAISVHRRGVILRVDGRILPKAFLFYVVFFEFWAHVAVPAQRETAQTAMNSHDRIMLENAIDTRHIVFLAEKVK